METLTQNLRSVVRSTPFLHKMLRVVLKRVRRTRIKDGPEATEKGRFRRYCLDLAKTVREPVFVKVGANDGLTGDPCSDILLADLNWTGLLIEPVPYCFDRLRTHFQDSRRFRLEQVAIGASAAQVSFYYVDPKAGQSLPNLPSWFDQLGSFDRNHIVKHLDGALEPFIVECLIQVYPLSEVLARNGIDDVHLLHVDTEGHDYEVIKTVNFAEHPPLSIFIEHKHLSADHRAEMLGLLYGHGYSVRDCGEDYFAIDEKATRLGRTEGLYGG
jgi:FkbM family methyltransferase